MTNGRSVELDVLYNGSPFAGQIGGEIESLSYVDNAADESDTVDITINAQDSKWLNSWLPDKGAILRPRIIGHDWERPGDRRVIECGLLTLDDIQFQDTPSTLQVGCVSKPNDSDFSDLEREYTWQNTSIKRIGQTIAERYGLSFSFDAFDYDIECDEQDASDSSYYNTLCKNYGLILKVYAKRIWVYNREEYKAKPVVRAFHRTQIKRGSFSWGTTLAGAFTGGTFSYTDPDKDMDIICTVGGGKKTKSVSRRATSVYDASVQLCAELNAANHGITKIKFSVDGGWNVNAGCNISLTGYGPILSGKYFVDKVTRKVSRSSGFTTDFACSKVEKPFYHWEVGGTIEYHAETGGESSSSPQVTPAVEEGQRSGTGGTGGTSSGGGGGGRSTNVQAIM